MSKLNDLLSNIITKLNSSVKVEPQELTEEQKAQARQNIGVEAVQAQVQSDWNQNDESAPDFIKNRIAYDKSSILFNDFVIFDDEGETIIVLKGGLEEGKLYTITIDDTYTYTQIARKFILGDDDVIAAGALDFFAHGIIDENIAPFIILNSLLEESIVLAMILMDPKTFDPINQVAVPLTGNHSIKIVCNDVKKIEQKYLPNYDWNANENKNGYIANRPMYKTTKEFVWLDETQVEAGQAGKMIRFNGFNDGWANVKAVKVIFDGVEYKSLFNITKEAGNSTELIDRCLVSIQTKDSDIGDNIFTLISWLYGTEEENIGMLGFSRTGTIKIILTIAEYKTLPYEYSHKCLIIDQDLSQCNPDASIVEALRTGINVYGKLNGEDVEVYYAYYEDEAPRSYTWKCRSLDGIKQYLVKLYDSYNPELQIEGRFVTEITATEAITAPETAQVGQAMAVKAVDDSGRPTEWEPIYPFQIITWEDDD